MDTLKLCGALIIFATADALAQSQTREPADPTQDPAPNATSDSRPSAPVADPSVNMGRNPAPSTQPTEGTLQDHRAPGAPPPRDSGLSGPNAARTDDSAETDSQSRPRLTAPTQVAAEPAIAGTAVVTNSNQSVGSVVETVFDSQGQPAFVVISSGESMTAVPYQTAKSMMNGEKLVIDRSKLAKAPKIRAGQWREGGERWKSEATQYWDRG